MGEWQICSVLKICVSLTRLKYLDMYNNLLKSAIIIKQLKSGLLLREMSLNSSFGIDIEKFSKSYSMILKK